MNKIFCCQHAFLYDLWHISEPDKETPSWVLEFINTYSCVWKSETPSGLYTERYFYIEGVDTLSGNAHVLLEAAFLMRSHKDMSVSYVNSASFHRTYKLFQATELVS